MTNVVAFPKHKVHTTLRQWFETRKKLNKKTLVDAMVDVWSTNPPGDLFLSYHELLDHAHNEVERLYPKGL